MYESMKVIKIKPNIFFFSKIKRNQKNKIKKRKEISFLKEKQFIYSDAYVCIIFFIFLY